jgi:glycerophosphoryl diester phosphodiesterase
MTKDGVFIALHDGSLKRTTDITAHPEFAERAKIDKKGAKYWVPEDFTLAEIRSLRCRQGAAGRPKDFDGQEGIPTLLATFPAPAAPPICLFILNSAQY